MARVFFFGAGATRAVASRAPLNDDILKIALRSTRLGAIQEEVENIRDFVATIFHGDMNSLPRLEDVLSIIDFNLREKTTHLGRYDYDDLIQLRNDFVRVIGHILKAHLEKLDSYATEDFVGRLNQDDSIISTNYDIVLDNALFNRSKNTNYGVRARRDIYPIEYADGTRRGGDYLKAFLNYGPIKLLKIHGSLNWLFCPRCQEIDVTLGVKGAAEYLIKGYPLFCSNSDCTSPYEPLLVTPTKFKLYENRVIREIWEMASTEISKADELIFIGYSLPEADTEIRCLLINAINRAANRYEITFVDREGGGIGLGNYKRIFGEINYLPIGFVNYISRL